MLLACLLVVFVHPFSYNMATVVFFNFFIFEKIGNGVTMSPLSSSNCYDDTGCHWCRYRNCHFSGDDFILAFVLGPVVYSFL